MPTRRSKFAKASKPGAARRPELGDRVTIPNSPIVWTILKISSDGFATLTFEDSNLQRFRVPVSDMKPAK
jgi:hypothetical protein